MKNFLHHYTRGLKHEEIVFCLFDNLTPRLCERFVNAHNWVCKHFDFQGNKSDYFRKHGIRAYSDFMKKKIEALREKTKSIYFKPLKIWVQAGTQMADLVKKYESIRVIGNNGKEHPKQLKIRRQMLTLRNKS